MDSNLLAPTHALYLLSTVFATVWVGRTLNKHGRLFLVDTFSGNAELASAVNQLLTVGFYLVNIGFVCLNVEDSRVPYSMAQMMGTLGARIGPILLLLGGMHFFNLLVFSRIRRRALVSKAPPPVAPAQYLAHPRAV
jgi:hypothetical protein